MTGQSWTGNISLAAMATMAVPLKHTLHNVNKLSIQVPNRTWERRPIALFKHCCMKRNDELPLKLGWTLLHNAITVNINSCKNEDSWVYWELRGNNRNHIYFPILHHSHNHVTIRKWLWSALPSLDYVSAYFQRHTPPGVSINFKTWVFYKVAFPKIEFFISKNMLKCVKMA